MSFSLLDSIKHVLSKINAQNASAVRAGLPGRSSSFGSIDVGTVDPNLRADKLAAAIANKQGQLFQNFYLPNAQGAAAIGRRLLNDQGLAGLRAAQQAFARSAGVDARQLGRQQLFATPQQQVAAQRLRQLMGARAGTQAGLAEELAARDAGLKILGETGALGSGLASLGMKEAGLAAAQRAARLNQYNQIMAQRKQRGFQTLGQLAGLGLAGAALFL